MNLSDRFIRLPENRLARAAILRVARRVEAGKSCPIVTLHGPSGLGKSELMQLLLEHLSAHLARFQGRRVAALDFSREMQQDPQTRAATLDAYLSYSLLIIEDLQQIRPEACEVFGNLLDVRSSQSRTTLITANISPSALELPQSIRGRLIAGLVVELTTPSRESRIRFARTILKELSMNVDANLLGWVCRHPSLRAIRGEISRLELLRSVVPSPMSLVDVHQASGVSPEPAPSPLESILRLVADQFNVQPRELCSSSRRQSIVQARQIAMYLAREQGCSLQEIGACFGGRDHSTVLHALRRVAERMIEDEDYRWALRSLEQRIVSA